MRVEKANVKAIILEIEEYQAMEKVIEVLEELEHKFGTENSLMSAEDGELVGIAELPECVAFWMRSAIIAVGKSIPNILMELGADSPHFSHRFWLRLTKAVGFLIHYKARFQRRAHGCWARNFHYNIPPAFCQEKSCTNIKKIKIPILCILPIAFWE